MKDGLVPAGEFIGLAEQTGQLRMLGHVMLELLDDDLQELESTYGSQLPIAVNVSASQLADRETMNWLLSWQPPGGLQRITFEITESLELTADSHSLDQLLLLQRLGAKISIDDFGHRVLQPQSPRPTPTEHHQDRPEHADGGSNRLALVGSPGRSGQVARALAEDVVIEGVETSREQALVNDLSVGLSQGLRDRPAYAIGRARRVALVSGRGVVTVESPTRCGRARAGRRAASPPERRRRWPRGGSRRSGRAPRRWRRPGCRGRARRTAGTGRLRSGPGGAGRGSSARSGCRSGT